jgi:hypothetical protein
MLCTEAPCLLLLRSFLTSISFVPNPNLYPEPPVQGYAAAALGAVALSQVGPLRCKFHFGSLGSRVPHASAVATLSSL